MDELTKIYHKDCGGHVGYVKDVYAIKKDRMNFYLLNMQHPDCMCYLHLGCAKCGKYIDSTNNLTLN